MQVKNPQGPIAGGRVTIAILRGWIGNKSDGKLFAAFAAFAMGHHPQIGDELQVPGI